MLHKFLYVLIVSVFFSATLQAHGGNMCAGSKKARQQMKTTIADPLQDFYDIKYIHLDIELTNLSTAVAGSATINAVTTHTLDTFVFELNNVITIDSVLVGGLKENTIVTNGSVRKVVLSTSYNTGVPITVQVFYQGQPASGNGQFFTGGLNHVKLSSGTEITYSLSDPDFTDDWWPCKQSLTDKIDSADIWITVASGLKAGSNGVLKNVSSMPANKLRYEWKTNYPIDYYLVCAAVSAYADYSYYMHFTDGSGDSMLIQNLVYDSATFMTPARVAALDSTGYIVDHFSKLFGRYPFYKEKYGHCIAEPLGGGMEHQTMTTLGAARTTLIAHELGHQWWGDNVTYTSWRDIWLSEGLATYCEQLFVENFWGAAPLLTYRTDVFNNAMNMTGGSVYVDDTTNVNRIFSYVLTYNKGAAVAHMLRYMAPQDSLFFKALRQYQQQFQYSNAVTTDLKTITEQVYGTDLDTFFNQWIYGEGYPTYSAKWYQLGGAVYVQLVQTASKASVTPLFSMPVELKLKSANGDTIIRVYQNKDTITHPFPWSEMMTGLEIDPNNNVLNKTGKISQDISVLNVINQLIHQVKVYPNPTREGWHITAIPVGSNLILSDITGKKVWENTITGTEAVLPATGLPNGNYILTVELDKHTSKYRLVKYD